MKKLVLAACAAAVVSACSPAPAPPAPLAAKAPTQAEIIAHGKYLVEGVGLCNDCHTPRNPDMTIDMTRTLQGGKYPGGPPPPGVPFAPDAPPLAGVPAGWTEAGLKKLLMTGESEDGSNPLPPMPPYHMNDADSSAVAAYIASLPKPPAPQPAASPPAQ